MQIKFQREADLVAVQTEGRITHSGLEARQEPISEALGQTIYAETVLLDLAGSDYLDSSGISWLLTCHKRFREAGGKLIVHSPSQMASQALRILRMDQVLHLAADARSARKLAQKEPA